MDWRAKLLRIFDETVGALSAERLVGDACRASPLRPGPGGRLVILALGKAGVEMARGALAATGDGASVAVVAAPHGAPAPGDTRITCLRGGHPVPDHGSLACGEALLGAAASARAEDAALVLVSGGGSSIAEAPAHGIALADVRAVNAELLRSGAPIEEVNVVRSHLSRLKGGGLARALHAAGVRKAQALLLVDVPSGAFASVASGPATADPSTFAEALAIVRARKVALPPAARRVLEEGAAGRIGETLKPEDPAASLVPHAALADLRAPARVAGELASGLGLAVEAVHPLPVRGPLEPAARRYAAWRPARHDVATLLCASGELDLAVPEQAPPGGRAQQLALAMAGALRGQRAAFLAAGTDGRDGPTDAAGALVDGTTWDAAIARGLDPGAALAGHAASPLLEALGALLPSRHTGAHLGEVHLLLRWP